jgi:hypothetical protein
MDTELLGELKKKYGTHPQVQTVQLDLTSASVPAILRSHAIDTILCVNVIEHIEDDRLAVKHLVESLPAGGHLCLLVPALPFLYGSLDELDGHYRRYTKRSLTECIDELPVDLVRNYYFNILGVPGFFLKSRLLRQMKYTDDNYKIMNALLPIVRPLEFFWPPPIGMSVIAICRRRA